MPNRRFLRGLGGALCCVATSAVLAENLACGTFVSPKGVSHVFYFRGSTCAEVNSAVTALGWTTSNCTTFTALAATAPPSDYDQLLSGAPHSGNLFALSSFAAPPGFAPAVAFLDISDGLPAFAGIARAGGPTGIEVTYLPLPGLVPSPGQFLATDAVHGGEAGQLPFDDPGAVTTADFTFGFTMLGNGGIVATELDAITVSALSFTAVGQADEAPTLLLVGVGLLAATLVRRRRQADQAASPGLRNLRTH